MTVSDRDASWAAFQPARTKVAALLAGRETALPYILDMPGHDAPTAKNYRNRAYFLPMTARTAEAMGGLVFSKAPTRSLPAALDNILADITRTGQDLDRFAEMVFDAVLATACVAVIVDYPDTPAGMTKKAAEANGIRPYMTLADGNSVIAARFVDSGAGRRLGHVRVLETVDEPSTTDEWAMVRVEQVRVFDLDEAGFYRQRVYRQAKTASGKNEWLQYGKTIEPRMNNARMMTIPVFFTNARDAEPRPSTPPLHDIADVNIAHLNDSAAYQWGIVWTANPTPVFSGFEFEDDEAVKLGSSEGISGPADAKAGFMEFNGTGLTEARSSMEGKRRDGALMGARMLMEDGRAAITAETARIQRAGETSIVSGIANAVSECLTKALTMLSTWAGIDPVVTQNGKPEPLSYWLNPDLNPSGMDPQMLGELLRAWQGGALSMKDLFNALQRGDIIEPSKSFEEHQEELDEEAPALGGFTDASMTDNAEAPADDEEQPQNG
jgi:hypothetical protein